jgi:hypothetical protein
LSEGADVDVNPLLPQTLLDLLDFLQLQCLLTLERVLLQYHREVSPLRRCPRQTHRLSIADLMGIASLMQSQDGGKLLLQVFKSVATDLPLHWLNVPQFWQFGLEIYELSSWGRLEGSRQSVPPLISGSQHFLLGGFFEAEVAAAVGSHGLQLLHDLTVNLALLRCPLMRPTDRVLFLPLKPQTVLLTFDRTLLHVALCLYFVAAVEEVWTGVGLHLLFLLSLTDRPRVDLVFGGQLVILWKILRLILLGLTGLLSQTASEVLICLLRLFIGVLCWYYCCLWIWIVFSWVLRGLTLGNGLRICIVWL